MRDDLGHLALGNVFQKILESKPSLAALISRHIEITSVYIVINIVNSTSVVES